MYYPLIMAGGTGTRLWPLSRRKYPKQALELVGDRTLIQHAVDRLTPQYSPEQILVITRQEHVEPLSVQVPELPQENFIVEPEGRGTAPAIGLAAIHLYRRDPEAVMAVLTADHFIEKGEAFRQALFAAGRLGCVMLQFPPWFHATRGNARRLEVLRERFGPVPLSVEFRHPSWLTGGRDDRVFEWLARLDMSYVVVDEPNVPTGGVPPTLAVTRPDLALVRFHGHHADGWKRGATVAERFNYL